MSITVSVSGTDALVKELRRFDDETKRKAVVIINDSVKEARTALKSAAPRGKTGKLRRSVKIIRRASARKPPLVGMVGFDRSKAPHAHFVLFGTQSRKREDGSSTGSIEGNDFLTPITERMRRQYVLKMRGVVK